MALSDFFLNPLGLLGLASLVPLIILYIIKPDPRRLEIPTVEFLPNVTDEGGSNPIIERLRRNLLLLLQILALIALSLALASPYVAVSKSAAAGNTVIVLDTTASMATETGGGTRFERALAEAKSKVTATTSVVVAGSSTNILLNQGSAADARNALDSVTVTDAEGDLRGAISQAVSLAGSSEDTRIVILSDFADDSAWESAVQTARASGFAVDIQQFNGGGGSNVGIIGLSFASGTVSVNVKNFGGSEVQRSLSIGGQTQSVTLGPGDVSSVRFNVPAGGGTIQMSPGDSFPTDDTAYIAAPSTSTIDVLMVTNDRNEFLYTALSAMNEVSVDVKNPPVGSFGSYDVMVFSNVQGSRILDRTIRKAKQVVRDGGGVVIQAQKNLRDVESKYGDLMIVNAGGVGTGAGASVVSESSIVDGIDFSSPKKYVKATLTRGRSLVKVTDSSSSEQSPLVAIAQAGFGSGRLMYYGYIEDSSEFKYNYLYPVFWKRSMYYLSGRERLSSLNRKTGSTLTFPSPTTVETPSGTAETTTVVMNDAGFYVTGSRRLSANLVSATESDVSSSGVNESSTAPVGGEGSSQKVPRELTALVALLALGVVGAEVAFMKYRGDI